MTCRIVIVDDDRIIRRSLSTAIPWKEHGFELAGEAADGEKGLALIKETNPQIVISDIKMPYMDGLEMAGKIKEMNTGIKVILLTGFEDFSFAQKAISVRAFDYLLKPVNRDCLLQKAKEARAEWEKEQNDRRQLDDHLPMRRQHFIRALLYKKVDSTGLEDQIRELGLALHSPVLAVLLVKLDEPVHQQSGNKRIKKRILSLAEQHFPASAITEMRPGEFAVIWPIPADMENWTMQIEAFQSTIRGSLHTSVTVTAGGLCDELQRISDAYSEASAAMEFRHIIGKDRFFTIEDVGESVQEAQPFLQQFVQEKVIEKVKMGMLSEVEQFFSEDRLQQLKKAYLPFQEVRMAAVHLLIMLSREVESWREERQKEIVRYVQDINGLQTIQEVFEKLHHTFIQMAQSLEGQRKKRSVVDEAVDYIKEHFCEEDLTLQKTASHVHMNAAYLSAQFKAEKGINFVDFLLDLRMKKAMQLLRQEQLKIYEVASMVGYSNPQYFSICFKQYTNHSPGQFKKLS
ncbi:response regulator [Domibacillus sp. 8LH]|uniref:response regulator n=1 Tax=Domibacillus sp. 8LH TaxID=3073900 RepID=UPI00316BF6BC